MAIFEIDQSGKWEENKKTVIGVTGAKTFSVLITRQDKNRILNLCGKMKQERNRSKKMRYIRMFAYSVFLALKEILRQEDNLVIDNEYEGKDDHIRDVLTHLFQKFCGLSIDRRQIEFRSIGKASRAHAVANQTFSGQREPDRQLGVQDYFNLLDRTTEIRTKAFLRRKNRK